MHPSAENVADALRALGVPGEVRELPEPAPTAATAAAQLGCEVGAIANSLVFSADGAPLLVMTSGAHRVDTSRVAALIGASAVQRADTRSVKTLDRTGTRGRRPGRASRSPAHTGRHLAGLLRRDLGGGGAPAYRVPDLVRRADADHGWHSRRRRRVGSGGLP